MRILISRPDRIGDVVLSTPIPREIKRKYPDSYIAVLLRSYTKDIYTHNPFVDDIIIYDGEKDSFLNKLWEIKKHRFTHGLMLLPNEKINYMMFLSGIKHRIGVGHKLFQFFLFYVMKYITIVTSGHPPIDERIFYKIAHSLKNNGYYVTIVCSNLEINTEKNGIVLSGFEGNHLDKSKKITLLENFISRSNPDLIICCEPLTIISAHNYKKKSEKKIIIISDITEWYPENVALKFTGIKRIIEYIKLFLFNIYTVNLADALIIGEVTKLPRYNIITPFKPKTIIGYYPVLEFFPGITALTMTNELTLGYAGVITFERGISTLLRIAQEIARKYTGKTLILKVAGKFQYLHEEELFKEKAREVKNVRIEFCEWVEYPQIAAVIKSMDICFDLRKKTFVYRNSLPIKIFEYMACGKPVIYSDIGPIRKEMQVENFGFLVNPEDDNEILKAVEKYLNDPKLLLTHSKNARKAVEDMYNWDKLEPKLIHLIHRYISI